MKAERRQQPRGPIDILFNAFQDGLPALCAGRDVSVGGIGLRTMHDNRRVKSPVVDVEFELPNASTVISARGRLRSADGRLAVVFDSISESHRAVIADYVSQSAAA